MGVKNKELLMMLLLLLLLLYKVSAAIQLCMLSVFPFVFSHRSFSARFYSRMFNLVGSQLRSLYISVSEYHVMNLLQFSLCGI